MPQYDGPRLTTVYDGANTLLRRYLFGPDEDEPIVWYEGSGLSDRRYLDADERGWLAAARRIIEAWRTDYNTLRPHSNLGGMIPTEFTKCPAKGIGHRS